MAVVLLEVVELDAGVEVKVALWRKIETHFRHLSLVD